MPDEEITLEQAADMLNKAADVVMREAARLRSRDMLSPTADMQIGAAAGGAFDLSNHARSLAQFARRLAEAEEQWQ